MLVLHLTYYTGGRTDLEKGVSVSKLESAAAEDGGWLKQYNRSLKMADCADCSSLKVTITKGRPIYLLDMPLPPKKGHRHTFLNEICRP